MLPFVIASLPYYWVCMSKEKFIYTFLGQKYHCIKLAHTSKYDMPSNVIQGNGIESESWQPPEPPPIWWKGLENPNEFYVSWGPGTNQAPSQRDTT